MSKRKVNLNGSRDSGLPVPALHFVNMPPERFDWSDRRPPQASPSPAGHAPAGHAPAGLAEVGGAAPLRAEATPSGPPSLEVRTRRSVHELQPGTTYSIGRDTKADLVMTDSRVSWRHAVLRVDGGSWIIEDLGSTNGTFLGPQRLDRIEISAECVIRLGNPDDGPVLRCAPQVAAGSAAPAAPPLDHPGTALSAPPSQAAPEAPPGPEPRHDDPESWWQPPVSGGPVPGGPMPGGPMPGGPASPPVGVPSRPPAAEPAIPRDPFPPREREHTPRHSAGAPDQSPQPSAPPAQGGPGGYQPGGGQPYPGSPYGAGQQYAEQQYAGQQYAEPQAPAQPDMLPSVDRRPTARMPLPAKAMRIGRVPDNELVLSDLNVSRHHAELRKSPTGSYEIVDLGSHNGTFVNGQRVTNQLLTEQDLVSIGSSTFRLKDGELRQFVDDGNITFNAQELVVKAGSKVLLDHVSFPIPEKCLLGVIGPSGAGKSTLLGALTGMRPATTGTVLYDNRDLYANYNELRFRIGLVPQESVLHTQLTARRALQYSAELRFPADIKPAERDGRVDEVMGELGLTKHANTRADRLSGGQLKRVNVAQELLTKPSLLFLDEPTSGLDPGLDKSVMEQMRDLAHDGRTVIVVTHSVDNLDTCDRLLVLVPGGRIAYYGPPEEGLTFFGQSRWAEVFQAFDRYPDRDWAAEYAASPAHQQYVLGQRAQAPPPGDSQVLAATPPVQRRGAFKQMGTLTRRYLRVIASDRGYLTFMALLPILLGALIFLVPAARGLAGPPGSNPDAGTLLLILVICACLAGMASSVRELVKERSILTRERAAGLSSGAYLLSKLLVLSIISIGQSTILVLIGVSWRPIHTPGAFITAVPLAELILGIAVLAVTSMCLGLFVSALVSTSEKAMPFLVLFTMVQVVLSGFVVPLANDPGLKQFAMIAPSRWGLAAVASTVNLNEISPPHISVTDPLWNPSSANWLRDMGVMIGLGLIFTLGAYLKLRTLGPRRRK
jgi:ABC-type multidrug transport system ATPase subunit